MFELRQLLSVGLPMVDVYPAYGGSTAIVAANRSNPPVIPLSQPAQPPTIAQSASATPGTVPMNGETLVNTASTGGTQQLPAVAMDRSGNFVIVWEDGASGGEINAQLYNASGGRLGNQFTVNSSAAGGSPNPSVAMNPSGQFVVVWNGNGNTVYAQVYNSAGTAIGTNSLLTSARQGNSRSAVAVAANGSSTILYEGNLAADNDGIYAQRLTALGAANGSPFLVNTTTAGPQINPSIAIDANGASVAAWTDNKAGQTIKAALLPAVGSASSEILVGTSGANNEDFSAVGVDATGNFTVAWSQTGATQGIYTRRFNASGSALDALPVQLANPAAAQQTRPAIAERPDGSFLIAWTAANNLDGNGNGIFAQAFNADGSTNGNPFLVNTTTQGNQQNATAVWNGSHLVVGWDGQGTGDNNGVFIQQYTTPTAAPTVATAASANPNPVTGSTAALSLLGADDAGESSLTYSWSVLAKPSGAVAPAFSVNGTNAAKSSTVTFTTAGNYILQSTISDPGGLSVTSQVQVQVNQTMTSIVVSPTNPTVAAGATEQFTATAFDQFGQPMATQPSFTWSSTGGGLIGVLGQLTAPLLGGSQTVTATANGISGSSTVNSVPGNTAAASPSTVSGTSTTLSVIGGSTSGTTYTWSVLSKPSGAVVPTFSQNGNSAAQTTTATFSAVGNYTFQVAIHSLLTTTQTVSVTVVPAVTSINVSSVATTVQENGQTNFSAVAHDQFAAVIASQPAFSWVIESGSGAIDQAGVFTAPGSGQSGVQTIAAKSGGAIGTAPINVVNAAPTIAAAAAATPSSVTGTSTTLSAVGADDGGVSNLIYTWATTGTPPAAVVFSANGTTAAANTTAEFSQAGSYNFQVTITDAEGLSVTSAVSVTVNQTLTSIVVTPATASVAVNLTQQFSAAGYDQFGIALASQPTFTWAVASGSGSISGSGLFTAPGTAGSTTVTATVSSVSGSTSIVVTGGANADSFPPAQTTVENVPITFSSVSGNAIVAGSAATQVEVSVAGGILTLSTTTGLTFINGTANGTYDLAFTGTLTAMNAALNGLVLTPTPFLTGDDPLTFITGSGGPTVFATHTIPLTVTATAPTIQTAAAANPSPVTGTSCALSVLGADDSGESNLTYIWSSSGSPPGPVTFAINGTNAAKSTTATFSKAGIYSFQVKVVNTSGLSVLSTVTVTVAQTVKTLEISPASVTVAEGASQPFTVTSKDQFGKPMNTPVLTWAVTSGSGTIDSTGGFTAGSTPGQVTISASGGSTQAQANITVPNTAPVVQTAASATTNSSTTALLNVLATDDSGEANLTYTWTATGPDGVILQTNGTNAAKNTVAIFSAPGTYDLTATITDAQGLTTTSSVSVTVTQSLSRITIAPPAASVHRGGSLQLTAMGYDQFGGAMLTQPGIAWAVASGVGSVDSSGVYTAPGMGTGAVSVAASSGGLTASIGFNIVNGLSESLPPGQATLSTQPLVFADGNSISITDSDPGTVGVPVSISISATGGTLSLTPEGIPTVGGSPAAGDSTLDLTGTVAELNAELQGMTFTPNTGFHGFGAVTVSIDEIGDQQVPSQSVPIRVQSPPPPVKPVIPPKQPVVIPVQPPVTPVVKSAGNPVPVLAAIPLNAAVPDVSLSDALAITTTAAITNTSVDTGDAAAAAAAAAPVIAVAPNANPQPVQAPPAPKDAATPAKAPVQNPPVAVPAPPAAAPAPAAPVATPQVTVPDALVQTDPGKVFTFLAPQSAMVQQLNQIKQEADSKPLATVRIIAGSATFASIGASAVYLLWLIRGGSLLFSMLSFFPAWRSIDPLPVLENFESKKRRKARIEGDSESLESLIDNSKPTSAEEPSDPPPIRLKQTDVSPRKAA